MSKNAKYCETCGAKNKATAKFCDGCGKPFDKPGKTTGDKPSRVSEGVGLEVVSLVTSILGFTCLPGIGFIIAVITGLMSPNPKESKGKQIRKSGYYYRFLRFDNSCNNWEFSGYYFWNS
ncbi:MAG: hypothetical protein ACTSPC_00555 [Candidatus Heimdallarchaeota archaeon]